MNEYQILNGLSPEYIESLKARFWAKVDTSNGPDACWEWTGARNSKGYGSVGIMSKSYLAHRTSYELFNGPIGNDRMVCHRCDNPACVRPSHLFSGDASVNMLDAARKGRLIPPRSKIGPRKARQIRSAFNPDIHKISEIARENDVSDNCIAAILKGNTYKRAGGKTYRDLAKNRISDNTFAKVKELHRSGMTRTAIAKRLGIGLASASRIVRGIQRVE